MEAGRTKLCKFNPNFFSVSRIIVLNFQQDRSPWTQEISQNNCVHRWTTTDQYPGHHGRDHMIVGFTTTYASSAHHHYSCEFESHSGKVCTIQLCVIKFVSELQQIGGFLRVLRFPPTIKLKSMLDKDLHDHIIILSFF